MTKKPPNTEEVKRERLYIEARKAAFTVAEYQHRDDPGVVAAKLVRANLDVEERDLKDRLGQMRQRKSEADEKYLEELEQFLPEGLRKDDTPC